MAIYPITLCVSTPYFVPEGGSLRENANVFERIKASRRPLPQFITQASRRMNESQARAAKALEDRDHVTPPPKPPAGTVRPQFMTIDSFAVGVLLGTEPHRLRLAGPENRYVPDWPLLISPTARVKYLHGLELTTESRSLRTALRAGAELGYLTMAVSSAALACSYALTALGSVVGGVQLGAGLMALGALGFLVDAATRKQRSEQPDVFKDLWMTARELFCAGATGAYLGGNAAAMALGLAYGLTALSMSLGVVGSVTLVAAAGVAVGLAIGTKEGCDHARARALFGELNNLCNVVRAYNRMPWAGELAISELDETPSPHFPMTRAEHALLERALESSHEVVRQAASDAADLLSEPPGTTHKRPTIAPPRPWRGGHLDLAETPEAVGDASLSADPSASDISDPSDVSDLSDDDSSGASVEPVRLPAGWHRPRKPW